MRVRTDTLLRAVVQTLREQVMPVAPDPYTADLLRMAANQVAIAAEAWDDAAELRVRENAELRVLFADAAPGLEDRDLAGRLAAAATSQDPSIRLSVLDVENGRLRKLLIALQAHLDVREDEPSRALNQRIWRLLAAIESARAPRA